MNTPLPQTALMAASNCLKALSHPVRLAMLCSLQSVHEPEGLSASDLQTTTGNLLGETLTQSNFSQHLAQMRHLGLLKTKKMGNQVFYQVHSPEVFSLISALKSLYCPD